MHMEQRASGGDLQSSGRAVHYTRHPTAAATAAATAPPPVPPPHLSKETLAEQLVQISMLTALPPSAAEARRAALESLNLCLFSMPCGEATRLSLIGSFVGSHSIESSAVDVVLRHPIAADFFALLRLARGKTAAAAAAAGDSGAERSSGSSRQSHNDDDNKGGQQQQQQRRKNGAAATQSGASSWREGENSIAELAERLHRAREWMRLLEDRIATHPTLRVEQSAVAAAERSPFLPHLLRISWGDRAVLINMSFGNSNVASKLARFIAAKMRTPMLHTLVMAVRRVAVEHRLPPQVITGPVLALTAIGFFSFHNSRTLRNYTLLKNVDACSDTSFFMGYLHVFAEGGFFDPATMLIDASDPQGIVLRDEDGEGARRCCRNAARATSDRLWRVYASSSPHSLNYADKCVQIHLFRRSLLMILVQLCLVMGIPTPRWVPMHRADGDKRGISCSVEEALSRLPSGYAAGERRGVLHLMDVIRCAVPSFQ